MKRSYLVYLLLLLPALLLAVLLIRYLTTSEYDRALRRLDSSERAYREARTSLVMGSGNPVEAVVAYAADTRRRTAVRRDALRILVELDRIRPLPDLGDRLLPLLDEGPEAFTVSVLEALAAMASVTAVPRVASMLREAQDSLLFTHCYAMLREAANPIVDTAHKALDDNDTARFDSCLTLLKDIPGGTGGLMFRWAGMIEKQGDTARARAIRDRVGYIDTCWVAGPFENTSAEAITHRYSPELRPFDLQDTFQIDDQTTARWLKVTHLDDRSFIVFRNLFVKHCCSVAYVYVPIQSPREQDALLMLGYFEPTAVWFNDSLVHRQVVYRLAYGDDDGVRLRLRAGHNHLLIKAVQDLNMWRLQCRLTDLYGEAIDVRLALPE